MKILLRRMTAAAAVAGLALVPGTGGASQVEDQLRQMQERLTQLEDRLQATSEQLEVANERVEEQEEILARAGVSDVRPAASGVAAFLETLEIGGWVAASYNYNFDDPDGSELNGFNSPTAFGAYPFHPDPNSFQLDQLWIELERPVTEQHRAGFRADFVYGKTAELLNATAPAFVTGVADADGDGIVDVGELVTATENADGFSGSDEDFELYQGYVQYLAPIGNGVHLKAGKFATVIGAEVAPTQYNYNITRGHVYNLFQPITHTGILASTNWGEGFSTAIGLVNETRSFPAADIDLNKDKAVLWSLGWSNDELSWSFNGAHGSADSGQGTNLPAGEEETIFDVILGWSPSETFEGYINADYIISKNDSAVGVGAMTGEFEGYGVAVAGRYALSDRMGLALRGEWVDLQFESRAVPDPNLRLWGLTGTLDYALTAQLKVRGELRYDNVRSSDAAFQNAFLDSRSSGMSPRATEDDQVVGLIEAIYSFNAL